MKRLKTVWRERRMIVIFTVIALVGFVILKAWWTLFSSYSFVVQFLANLLSNLLVALFIGVYLIDRRRRREEARVAAKRKEILLRAIKQELEDNKKEFERVLRYYQNGYAYPFFVKMTFWEVLRPSGELPKLISYELLDAICEQYYYLQKVMVVQERFLTGSYPDIAEIEMDICDMIAYTLKSALENHSKVIKAIDSEPLRL